MELEDLRLSLPQQVELFLEKHPSGEDFKPFVRYLDDMMKERILDKGTYMAEWMEFYREGN